MSVVGEGVGTQFLRLGWEGVGPQVNKFEQVSSDDHQMSVPGEGGVGTQVPYLGPISGGGGWEGLSKSHVWRRGGLPYRVTYPMMYLMLPTSLPRGQTDACGNITVPKLCLRAVDIIRGCSTPFWEILGPPLSTVLFRSIPRKCSPRNISGEPSIVWAQESNQHFIKSQ